VALIWIPALLRDLTAGKEHIRIPGATVREAIEALDQLYPGIQARLVEGDRLRPGIALVVDGEVSSQRLRHKLEESSEVHFLPAIGGG
jgi:sulfur-carrier protein